MPSSDPLAPWLRLILTPGVGPGQQGAPGEVVPEAIGVLAQAAEDAQGLTIALEAAKFQHVVVEDLLAIVAESRMANIVGQTGGLDEMLGRHPGGQRLHPLSLAIPGQTVGQRGADLGNF